MEVFLVTAKRHSIGELARLGVPHHAQRDLRTHKGGLGGASPTVQFVVGVSLGHHIPVEVIKRGRYDLGELNLFLLGCHQ